MATSKGKRIDKATGEIKAGGTVASPLEHPKELNAIERRIRALKAQGATQAIGYADTFDFGLMAGAEVTGKIVAYRNEVGQYDSSLIVLTDPETLDERDNPVAIGKPVSVWLGADMAMKIEPADIGRVVTVIYVDQIDTGSGNPMKCYEVLFHGPRVSPAEAAAVREANKDIATPAAA